VNCAPGYTALPFHPILHFAHKTSMVYHRKM